jgi:hypothetical protein
MVISGVPVVFNDRYAALVKNELPQFRCPVEEFKEKLPVFLVVYVFYSPLK